MRMNIERLRRGALRFLILDALNKKPMHAYEIMKTIEIKFNGVYKPSPGSLYPVLKSLIKEDLVKVEIIDEKKVYSLTEKGRDAWGEAKSNMKSLFSRSVNYRKLLNSLFDISLVLYTYRDILTREETFEQINSVLEDCRAKIEEILGSHNSDRS
ncbi:PadR family transcriptional regulator [Metallosphaera hakonensis]|uniref:PadR family transcriptional regulator n=1 Tax=Metallosphaera hakonensis JCM 8857 = DSM 7519 TaxID=1293036 RepID=A0A2U9IS10_9CREN|nr:PadR family transcriptional regulator [Metallosphaera hakonensis]AWR98777.1 PadR family transcriptional regulator [Metallosphaera hakonensis JCM 8857 = DSM 7519]